MARSSRSFRWSPSRPKPKPHEAKEATGKPPPPALYLKMDPQLVVNFDASSEVKFLALDIEFMARDQAVLDDVQRNMPKIRNNLLMLIGNRDYKTLMSREGKDALRLEALDETKRVLQAGDRLRQARGSVLHELRRAVAMAIRPTIPGARTARRPRTRRSSPRTRCRRCSRRRTARSGSTT